MRAFVVIACLAVLVSADVKHLYDAPYKTSTTTHTTGSAPIVSFVPTTSSVSTNYIKPNVVTVGQYDGPSGFSSTNFGPAVTTVNRFNEQSVGSVPVTTSTGFGGQYSTGSGFGGQYGSGSGFGGQYGSGSGLIGTGAGFGGSYHDSTSYGGHSKITVVKQTAPIVTKSSYVFAAPEDKEDFQRDQTIVLARPRQHYKVVFIKAPATTIVNTPSAAFAPQAQEKTLIYVLSDKKRIENKIDLPQLDHLKPQKPEVFFIKNNKPTEYTQGQVKYETVDAVNGAENGALNGVANQVHGTIGGHLQDEGTRPEHQQIANQIYQAVQTGGLESGVQTVDTLISAGYPVSTFGGAGNNFGSGSTHYGGSSSQFVGSSGSAPSRGNFETITTTVQQPSTTYATGLNYPTGGVSTGFVQQQPAHINYGSGSSYVSGSSYPEQGYNYGTGSGAGTSYSQTASGTNY